MTEKEIQEIRPYERFTGPLSPEDLMEMPIEARWKYEELRELCDLALLAKKMHKFIKRVSEEGVKEDLKENGDPYPWTLYYIGDDTEKQMFSLLDDCKGKL